MRPKLSADKSAAMCVDALLERGAHVVLTTYVAELRSLAKTASYSINGKFCVAERCRFVTKQKLLLERTFDETLMKFGKQTRFNLRYYRRRLEARIPLTFVADARSELSEEKCVAINANSLNPVPESECRAQF